MKKNLLCIAFASLAFSGNVLAEDITGTWKTIDDKTGSSKAILEMRQENNGTYTAKIIKVTPRPGYTPKETCINCPAPYTNKPILGLDILTGLKAADDYHFVNAKVLDPLTGKIYSGKAKLSANGKRLTLRGYVGVSALGRSQTWIKQD
ncbi:DUF2147 domain-containing protein [Acinetobacter sp. ANC 4779]|uniref:DUF2147 domain-containing protein n=1 Tax=Acinetobacter Taxon 24C TaxID=2839060 RepID=UPI0007D79300|nr:MULTISPECIES: DUF2147 domain-containing protein [Acinetobacter Taxon 24C]OAL80852.1 signal peptidase [Acinetobacter sp. SFB]TCB52797.1 DUF2147 domain-containing protein [Acinetobacter sp. ANC 4779]